jgi:uncharacterized membrane protein
MATDALGAFITQYFTGPITNPAVYGNYNLVSTLTYAAILLAVSFFVIYPVLARRGVRFDARFALAVIPYVLWGSAMRILEDLQWSGAQAIPLFTRSANPLELGYYFVSPGIYLLVGVATIAALLITLRAFGRERFQKPFGIIGLALAVPFLAFDLLHIANGAGFLLTLALFAVLFTAVTLGFRLAKRRLLKDTLNRLAFAGQLLDGTATFMAISFFGFSEQHVVSSAILGISPLLFPVIKIALILAILYYIDRELQNPNLRGFAKLFVTIIGFAPGIRDLLSLGVLGTTFGGLF